jgi:hypothetical protein
MPEFVACPACGFRMQMADAVLGRRVRCPGCGHSFVAGPAADVELPPQRVEPLPARAPEPAPPRPAGPPPLPRDFDRPPPADDPPRPPRRAAAGADEDAARGPGMPLCPACSRGVPWDALRCPHCGVELEPDDRRHRGYGARLRRDCEPHRGRLIQNLGTLTLCVGGLSLCLFGGGLVVALPLGLITWAMASRDLAKMRRGEMEPEGRGPTKSGRTSALTGVVLSLVFAAGYTVLFVGKYLY